MLFTAIGLLLLSGCGEQLPRQQLTENSRGYYHEWRGGLQIFLAKSRYFSSPAGDAKISSCVVISFSALFEFFGSHPDGIWLVTPDVEGVTVFVLR